MAIARVNALGFRTALHETYLKLSGQGLGPDQYDQAMQPIYICDLI